VGIYPPKFDGFAKSPSPVSLLRPNRAQASNRRIFAPLPAPAGKNFQETFDLGNFWREHQI
jgi:hypothetical protein